MSDIGARWLAKLVASVALVLAWPFICLGAVALVTGTTLQSIWIAWRS